MHKEKERLDILVLKIHLESNHKTMIFVDLLFEMERNMALKNLLEICYNGCGGLGPRKLVPTHLAKAQDRPE